MKNIFLFCLFVFLSKNIFANDFTRLDQLQANGNPFVKIHGLPGYSPANDIFTGQFITQIDLAVTNEFHQATKENEQVFLDYERSQLSLSLEYGIMDGLSTGVMLPYFSNSGGFMDGLIENWHELFGLPQGGREDAARDEFNISYRSTEQRLLLDETDQGIGDISLFLDKRFLRVENHRVNARASLKLPTGDEDQLFGSGGYSFSLSLNGSKQLTHRWQAYGMIGLSYLRDSKVLPSLQANIAASAVLGMTWLFRPKWAFAAQLDFNSEVYDGSDLDAINGKAGVLSVFSRYEISDKVSWVIGFNEDVINKDAAPDFGINIGFNYNY